jgi:hypothetical protein
MRRLDMVRVRDIGREIKDEQKQRTHTQRHAHTGVS